MAEDRHRMAERLEQQDVLRRVADVVLAADHVADLHRRVVDDDREVVERRPVAADDDEVAAEVGRVDLDPVADQVVPADDARADAEADRRRPALGEARGALLGGQRGAAPDVARRQLGGLLGLAVGVELLGRAEAGIGEVGGEQPVGGRARSAASREHLAIGRVRPDVAAARRVRALVPVDPEPVEAVEDVALERGGRSGRRRCPRGGRGTCRRRGGRTGS